MHILYICHYFHPEPGAPSARGLEMARVWKEDGHRVSVLTCMPNHPTGVVAPGYTGRRYLREQVEGLDVHRLFTYATPNKGFLKKTLGHLVFMAAVVLQGKGKVRRPDVVVVSSPTLFSVIGAWLLATLYRVPLIFEVRDLWPAAIAELGMMKKGLAYRILEGLELFLYRRSQRVVVVTQAFARILQERGLPAHKLAVITNGVDVAHFQPAERQTKLRAELGLQDRFVVLYAGAHGISHGLSAVLKAAEQLRPIAPVHFLFVGDGAAKEQLVIEAAQAGLTNVTFLPSQPKQQMPELYATADVCLVPLRRVPLFQSFIPSKLFEILATGRPIVAAVEGEAAEILRQSGAAEIAPPEDADQIARAILHWYNHPDEVERRTVAGRAYVVAHYDRQALARRYEAILQATVDGVKS